MTKNNVNNQMIESKDRNLGCKFSIIFVIIGLIIFIAGLIWNVIVLNDYHESIMDFRKAFDVQNRILSFTLMNLGIIITISMFALFLYFHNIEKKFNFKNKLYFIGIFVGFIISFLSKIMAGYLDYSRYDDIEYWRTGGGNTLLRFYEIKKFDALSNFGLFFIFIIILLLTFDIYKYNISELKKGAKIRNLSNKFAITAIINGLVIFGAALFWYAIILMDYYSMKMGEIPPGFYFYKTEVILLTLMNLGIITLIFGFSLLLYLYGVTSRKKILNMIYIVGIILGFIISFFSKISAGSLEYSIWVVNSNFGLIWYEIYKYNILSNLGLLILFIIILIMVIEIWKNNRSKLSTAPEKTEE